MGILERKAPACWLYTASRQCPASEEGLVNPFFLLCGAAACMLQRHARLGYYLVCVCVVYGGKPPWAVSGRLEGSSRKMRHEE